MQIEIDPAKIEITSLEGDHRCLEYDGVILREHVSTDSLIATCPSLRGEIVQCLFDAMSAHQRLEFFRKTRANQPQGTHIQYESEGIWPDDEMCQK